MKKSLLSFVFAALCGTTMLMAQGFNYQAVLRDASGSPLANQTVSLRFTISGPGGVLYSETQTGLITNAFGLINTSIGSGSAFEAIEWGALGHSMLVEVDTGNGFQSFGTVQFQSVPYSKVATDMKLEDLRNVADESALTGQVLHWNGSEWSPATDSDNQTLSISGNSLSISNGNSVTLPTGTTYTAGTGIAISGNTISNTGDLSNTNEFQTLSISGNSLSISNGNSVTLPTGTTYTAGTGIAISGNTISNTGDLSNTNEIQTLSLSGNSLSISNGNSVTIPGGTITGVTAGTGLSGGGTSGNVTLAAQNDVALWNASKLQGKDVTITNPMFGHALVYDGTKWVNALQNDGDWLFKIDPDRWEATFPVQASAMGLGMTPATGVSLRCAQRVDLASSGILLTSAGTEALWFDGNYFSWGFGANHNYFAKPVGIGTTAPTHLLHVNGVARSTQSTWATSSDRRVKTNVQPLTNALSLISRFNPVTFNWTETYRKDHPALREFNYGFIAQEVEAVIPEMVSIVSEKVGEETIDDFRVLNTDALFPILVRSVQELQQQNETLRQRLDQQQAQLEQQAAMIRDLQLKAEAARVKQ
ncbi:MAG: hypothetical protein Kow0027_14080 [Saprospiraceae bacterium]